jgi:esterase/lipase superfamily enzyme
MTAVLRYNKSAMLIESFKAFYSNFLVSSSVKLSDIYSEDLLFVDPVHQVQGLTNVTAYFDNMGANLSECKFEYSDELVANDAAYIKWNMHYRHPKISKEVITLRGVTHIQFTDKIHYHEDIYDLGSMLYEHLPLMGPLTRMLKARLAKQ